jgi:hypothetical protein
MNDKFERLYKYLYENGNTSLPKDEFYRLYSEDQERLNRLHGYLASNGMTTITADQFRDEYFPPSKKKITQEPTTLQASPRDLQDSLQRSLNADVQVELSPKDELFLRNVSMPDATRIAGYSERQWRDAQLGKVSSGGKVERDFLPLVAAQNINNPALAGAAILAANLPVVGDYIDDLARELSYGLVNNDAVSASFDLMKAKERGAVDPNGEEVQNYLEAAKRRERFVDLYGESEEVSNFLDIVDSEGDSAFGILRGLIHHPTAAPLYSAQMASLLFNKESMKAAGGTLAAGAGVGAGIGALAGGIPAIPGAGVGLVESIPIATSLAAGVLDKGFSFSQFLTETLQEMNLEPTSENISRVLNDPNLYAEIYDKASNRGMAIGLASGFTSLFGASFVASAMAKGVSPLVSGIGAAGIGTVGEGAGEFAAQLSADQEISPKEIALEMIGGPGEGIVAGVSELIRSRRANIDGSVRTPNNPSTDKNNPYKVNGNPVDREVMVEMVENLAPENVAKLNLEFGEDKELADLVDTKRLQARFMESMASVDMMKDMDPMDLRRLAQLEVEKAKLAKTQVNRKAVDPLFVTTNSIEQKQIEEIDSEIELILNKYYKSQEEKLSVSSVPQEVATEPASVTVREALNQNRVAVLNSFGTTRLSESVTGALYVDGQSLVLEADNKIYELGSIAEVMDKPLSEVGLSLQKPTVEIDATGAFNIDNKKYAVQEQLPNLGIEYNQEGLPYRVSLMDVENGSPVMFEGQRAVDIAYQALLMKAQSPEQAARVDEVLNSEEFQNEYERNIQQRDLNARTKAREVVPASQRKADTLPKANKLYRNLRVENKPTTSRFNKIAQRLIFSRNPEETAKALFQYDELIYNGATAPEYVTRVYNSVLKDLQDKGYTYDGVRIGMDYTPDMDVEVKELPSNNIPTGKSVITAVIEPELVKDGEKVKKAKAIVHTGVGNKGSKKSMIVEDDVFTAQNKTQLQKVMREVFGLGDAEAKATAAIIHRMISNKAKREGISVQDMYNKISWTAREDKLNMVVNDDATLFQSNLTLPSGITISYDKNTEKFAQLEEDGFITRDRSILDFSGNVVLHQPDDMGSLDITDENQVTIVNGKGGMFFAVRDHDFGYVWAAGDKRSADKLASMINESATTSPDANGKMVLTSGGRTKNLSNYLSSMGIIETLIYWGNSKSFNISLDNITTMVNDAAISFRENLVKKLSDPKIEIEDKEAIQAALDGFEVAIDTDIETTRTVLREALRPPLSFAARREFIDVLFRNINKTVKDRDSVNQIIGFFRDGMDNPYFKTKYQGENRKDFSVPLSALEDGFAWMLAEPYIRDISRNNQGTGYVYSVVEVVRPQGMDAKAPLVRVLRNDVHESYPYVISTVSDDVKVRLHILKDNMYWQDSIGDPVTKELLYSKEDPFNASELNKLNAIQKDFEEKRRKRGLTKEQKKRQEYLKKASRLFPPSIGLSTTTMPIVESVKAQYDAVKNGQEISVPTLLENLSAVETDNRTTVTDVSGNPVFFQNRRAAVVMKESKYIVYALTDPDVSSPIHEMAHIFEDSLTTAERQQVLDWAGHSEWTVETSEMFASGAEKYIYEGVTADPKLKSIFEKFREWLELIYMGIKGSPLELELNDNMRDIYERIFNESNVDNVTHEYGSETDVVQDKVLNQGVSSRQEFIPRERTPVQESVLVFRKVIQSSMARVLDIQSQITEQRQGKLPLEQDFRMFRDLMPQRVNYRQDRIYDMLKDYSAKLLKSGITNEDVHAYMYLAHADERDALVLSRDGREFGSGLTSERRAELASMIQGKEDKIKPFADMLYGLLAETRSNIVSYGLETKESVDAWTNMFQNYVPLDGIASDEKNTIVSAYPRGGSGLAVKGKMFSRIKGRKSEVSNVPANIFNLALSTIARGEKNKVMNSLAAMVQNNPAKDFWKVIPYGEFNTLNSEGKKGAVEFRFKGNKYYVHFKGDNAQSHARALQKMDVAKVDRFSRLMASLTINIMRKTITTQNPAFFVPNYARDFEQAIIFAINEQETSGGYIFGSKFSPLQFAKTVSETAYKLFTTRRPGDRQDAFGQHYLDYMSLGGKSGFSSFKELKDVIDEINKLSSTSTLMKAKRVGDKVYELTLGVIEEVNSRFEDTIRLATYISAVEAGAPKDKAAQLAKNVTVNFNEHGDMGHVLGSHYIFFNAAVQGAANTFRMLTQLKPAKKPNGDSRAWHERISSGQKSLMALTTLGFFATLYNMNMSDEDDAGVEEYSQVDDFYKIRNFILMKGQDRIQMPLAYGLSPFYNLGVAMAEGSLGLRSEADAAAFWAESLLAGFSPFSVTTSETFEGTVAKTFAPTWAKPGLENMLNENYLGEKYLRERMPNDYTPESEMSYRSPKWMQETFRSLNSITGGSAERSGVVDVNPDRLWHWFEAYYGGLGRFVDKSYTAVRKGYNNVMADEAVEITPYDIPIISSVYGKKAMTWHPRKYRERKLEIKQLVAEYEDPEARQPDPTKQRYKNIMGLDQAIKEVDSRLRDLRAQERAIRNSNTMTYAKKQNELFRIREEMFKVTLLFNKYYNETRGTEED